jgi:hypothetical protein
VKVVDRMKMERARSSETSISHHITARRRDPEDLILVLIRQVQLTLM